MKYNFDEVIDRRNTYSYKWDDYPYAHEPSDKMVPMWVADMDFPCADEIVRAVRERAEHPIYGYSNAGSHFGDPAVHWMQKRYNWTIVPEDVLFCPGVVPALSACITAFTNPGDKIVIQQPVYYPFSDIIHLTGREILNNELLYDKEREQWVIDFKCFEEKVKTATLFILCNPHNPVGRVYSAEELKRMGDICMRYGVKIISDEIHSDLVFKPNKHIPIASLSDEIADHTITCISPSKGFNIAGLQTACMIIRNRELYRTVEKELNKSMHVMNLFGTVAYMTAYEKCEDYIEEVTAYIWSNYEYLDEYLKENMPKIRCQRPQATYLMWLDCSELQIQGQEIFDFFVNEAHISIDNGELFGSAGKSYARLNIATPRSNLERALRQLKEAYDKRGY